MGFPKRKRQKPEVNFWIDAPSERDVSAEIRNGGSTMRETTQLRTKRRFERPTIEQQRQRLEKAVRDHVRQKFAISVRKAELARLSAGLDEESAPLLHAMNPNSGQLWAR